MGCIHTKVVAVIISGEWWYGCSECKQDFGRIMPKIPDEFVRHQEMADECITRPPLGIKPRALHNRERVLELLSAMHRYIDYGRGISLDWMTELWEILRLNKLLKDSCKPEGDKHEATP